MAFALQSAKQIGAAVVRVTLGDIPRSSDARAPHDATNPLNWKVIGAQTVSVDVVRTVSADPYSYDLVLTAVLTVGPWRITALDIQTRTGSTINGQTVAFTAVNAQNFFTNPREQATSEDVLRQNLNKALDGPGWKAWVAAIGYVIDQNRKTAEAAFNQRWLKSSSGVYLERNAGSYGLDKPPEVGFGDDDFRQLAIDLNANKVNRTSVESVLRAYYGLDGTQAHAESQTQPYALQLNDMLAFKIDGQLVEVLFVMTNDFTNIGAARAQEVAAVINRRLDLLGMLARARPYTDPETGLITLRIYSALPGLRGKIQFFGGRALDALRFPEVLTTLQTVGTTWEYRLSSSSNDIPQGRARLMWIGGTDPVLTSVYAGRYLNIWGAPFNVANRGYFEILDSTSTYVEFAAPLNAVAQASVVQTGARDVFFVNPKLIYLQGAGAAYVSQNSDSNTDVFLPATTQAVTRSLATAWYLNGMPSIQLDTAYANARANSSNTVTIKTVTPHGLSVGRRFWLDELSIDYTASLGATQFIGASSTSSGRTTGAYLLSNNKILTTSLIGTSTTEWSLYDPLLNTWSAPQTFTGIDNSSANPATGCLMSTGKVFMAGRAGWSVYTPSTSTWTTPAAYPFTVNAVYHRGCLQLKNGKVLFIFTGATGIESALFDPVFQIWSGNVTVSLTNVPLMLLWQMPAAIQTADGDALLCCGNDGGSGSNKAWFYEAAGNYWGLVGNAPFNPSINVAGVFVPRGARGEIWVVGTNSGFSYNNIMIFNLATFTWSARPLVTAGALNTLTQTLIYYKGFVYFVTDNNSAMPWEQHDPSNGLQSLQLTGTTGTNSSGSNNSINNVIFRDQLMAFSGLSGTNVQYSTAYLGVSPAFQRSGGFLAGRHTVTGVIDPQTLTFSTSNSNFYTRITGGKLTPVLPEATSIKSGYILNPTEGIAITESVTVTTAILPPGPSPSVISVTDTSLFPDAPGYVVLQFGFKEQLVLRYLGKAGATQLRLASGQNIQQQYGIGTTVVLLQNQGPYAPSTGVGLTATYITGSSVGRIEAEDDVNFVKGSGLPVTPIVVYPGDRGLGNEGQPKHGQDKLSDAVVVWGSDTIDLEIAELRDDE